jgi:hypothetical protein
MERPESPKTDPNKRVGRHYDFITADELNKYRKYLEHWFLTVFNKKGHDIETYHHPTDDQLQEFMAVDRVGVAAAAPVDPAIELEEPHVCQCIKGICTGCQSNANVIQLFILPCKSGQIDFTSLPTAVFGPCTAQKRKDPLWRSLYALQGLHLVQLCTAVAMYYLRSAKKGVSENSIKDWFTGKSLKTVGDAIKGAVFVRVEDVSQEVEIDELLCSFNKNTKAQGPGRPDTAARLHQRTLKVNNLEHQLRANKVKLASKDDQDQGTL